MSRILSRNQKYIDFKQLYSVFLASSNLVTSIFLCKNFFSDIVESFSSCLFHFSNEKG
nr:MAG TPA: Somatostatin/Cortistatin family [Caudoviricetes sp.]